MRKIYIFLIVVVSLNNCCISCIFEDKTIDVSVLPEETTTGKNTFGCVIDGWVYVGGRYHDDYYTDYADTTCPFPPQGQYSILFFRCPVYNQIKALARLGRAGDLLFVLNNPREGQECVLTDVYLAGKKLPDGVAFITLLDTERCIISGRFECGDRIHFGRFDVVYHKE
ncbi:MAG: hypothetical protein LBF19_05120 [Prevotellaceae bacterium]|jgi:hypothetical protein|nr:hypothetical protein [Prevotellaceae bacterium]